jgi:hypothetical protein
LSPTSIRFAGLAETRPELRPDAKPRRAKTKKKDAERPRGPIPIKSTRRSFNLEDDTSPDVDLTDMDDFATSKPRKTKRRNNRRVGPTFVGRYNRLIAVAEPRASPSRRPAPGTGTGSVRNCVRVR